MKLKICNNIKIIKSRDINIGIIDSKKKYYIINFILLIKLIQFEGINNKSLFNWIIFLIKNSI